MNVPQALNLPGVMLVAPRNAAANAGSRKLVPEVGSAAPVVPAYMTPAIALTAPATTNAEKRRRPTSRPLKRATLRPRPTNSNRRPSGRCSSAYQNTTQSASP
jgi:hypothetical protein